jgi:hypothetical protein
VQENIRTGLISGLIMATLYSAYAAFIFSISGPEAFVDRGTTLDSMLVSYYAAGILGGTVIGAMIPLARSFMGRALIGWAGAFIVFFCLTTAVEGPLWQWQRREWIGLLVATAFFGTVCPILWARFVD